MQPGISQRSQRRTGIPRIVHEKPQGRSPGGGGGGECVDGDQGVGCGFVEVERAREGQEMGGRWGASGDSGWG